MFVVSSCSCLCQIQWGQVLSRGWSCSWSRADRRCSNYIWVINNFVAYYVAPSDAMWRRRSWSTLGPYSTSLGCRRQPSLACHAWNHGKSPKSSPLSQQCRFHCHTWSAGESHYCVNSNGFMKFGTHTNEESDEYQQKWLPLSDFVGLCSKYIAIPYGSMAFILKNPSFQITRCF